jgi:hypothetical protein
MCQLNIVVFPRALARVRRILKWKIKKFPEVDFYGAFFTVAAKSGSSDIVHIDFNDHPASWTWAIPIGDWKGGEFCCPQLGIKVPIASGQAFGAMTRVLAHFSAPISDGERVILTCFSDRNLIEHALNWRPSSIFWL